MIKNEPLIMDEHTLLNNKMCKILRDITGEEFKEVISQEEVDAVFKGKVNAEVCRALDNVRKKIDEQVSAEQGKSLKEKTENAPEMKRILKNFYKAIDDEKNAHLDAKYYCVTDRIFVHFHRIGAQLYKSRAAAENMMAKSINFNIREPEIVNVTLEEDEMSR